MTFEDARSIPTERVAEALGLGRGRRFRCPLTDHGDIAHYAPVTVSRRTNRWYCPLCRKGGDGPHLVAVTRKISESDALAWMAELDFGAAVFTPVLEFPTEDVLVRQAPIYEAFLAGLTLGNDYREYLRRRGLSDEAIALSGAVSSPTYARLARALRDLNASEDELLNMGLMNAAGHPRFYKHTLLFPILVDGRVRGITARRMGQEEPRYLAAFQRQFLYGVDQLADHDPVCLCEGVFDTLTLWSDRCPAVGILGVEAFAYNLAEFWRPLRGRRVVLAFDHDDAGRRATTKLRSLLPTFGVEPIGTLRFGEKFKDVSDERLHTCTCGRTMPTSWAMRPYDPFRDAPTT